MIGAARSSSAAPSRSEQSTLSTFRRPGALWAAEVERGGVGATACAVDGGVVAAGDAIAVCAPAPILNTSRIAAMFFFSPVPLIVRFASAATMLVRLPLWNALPLSWPTRPRPTANHQ